MATTPRTPNYSLYDIPHRSRLALVKKETRWEVPLCIQCEIPMKQSSGCKAYCPACGYLMTCNDTI